MKPIGLQVVERESAGGPTLIPGSIGNVAVVVQSPLGPEDEVIRISSVDNFQTIFGGADTAYQSYYEIRGLFENAAPFRTNVYCLRAVATGGTAASLEDGLAPDTIMFERAYLGKVSTGAKGNDTAIELVADPSGESFTLLVYLQDSNGNEFQAERIGGLTTDNIEGLVNQRSKYVKVSLFGTYALTAVAKANLTGGTDPTYAAEVDADQLKKFDNDNVQILFSPDTATVTSANTLEAYCAGRGDMIALVAAPSSVLPGDVRAEFTSTLMKAKSFAAGYFNWMKVDDRLGGDGIFTPALGHIIGAYYLRKLHINGGHAFVPPAGLTIALRGVIEQQYSLGATDTEDVVDAGMNVIQFYKGYGFVTRTSRTLSTLNKHYSIHIRRSLNFLINTFRSQLGVFEQRQNNVDTRRQLATSLTNFLFEQYRHGMFETEGGFESNVLVKVDEENNTEMVRQAREMVADVAMNFSEVAETIYVNLFQSDGKVSADVS